MSDHNDRTSTEPTRHTSIAMTPSVIAVAIKPRQEGEGNSTLDQPGGKRAFDHTNVHGDNKRGRHDDIDDDDDFDTQRKDAKHAALIGSDYDEIDLVSSSACLVNDPKKNEAAAHIAVKTIPIDLVEEDHQRDDSVQQEPTREKASFIDDDDDIEDGEDVIDQSLAKLGEYDGDEDEEEDATDDDDEKDDSFIVDEEQEEDDDEDPDVSNAFVKSYIERMDDNSQDEEEEDDYDDDDDYYDDDDQQMQRDEFDDDECSDPDALDSRLSDECDDDEESEYVPKVDIGDVSALANGKRVSSRKRKPVERLKIDDDAIVLDDDREREKKRRGISGHRRQRTIFALFEENTRSFVLSDDEDSTRTVRHGGSDETSRPRAHTGNDSITRLFDALYKTG